MRIERDLKHLSTEGHLERRNLAKKPEWEGGVRPGKSGHHVVTKVKGRKHLQRQQLSAWQTQVVVELRELRE